MTYWKTNFAKLTATAGMVLLALLIVTQGAVRAGEAPSNQELYRMLRALEAQQKQLINELRATKAEAAKAKAELRAAKAALGEAQRKIAATANKLNADKLDKVVAKPRAVASLPADTRALAGTTVMGSQLSPSAVMVAPQPTGAFGAVAFNYLMGSDQGMDFAVVNSTTNLFNPPGNDGPLHALGDEYQGAVSVILGWNTGNGTDVRGTLDYYDHSNTETIVSDGTFAIQASQIGPNSRIDENDLNDSGDFAEGTIDRKVVSGGLEIGKTLAVGSDLALRISTGVNAASIQNVLTAYYADVDNTDSHLTIQDNDIRAYGGRLGVAADWRVMPGLSVGLAAGAALLYAQRNYKITQLDSNTLTPTVGDGLLNFSADERFVMPAIDLEVAATWQMMLAGLATSITVGYDFQTWIGAIKDVRQVDDVDENVFTTANHDLTLHGPFVRVGVALQEEQTALK